MFPDTTQISYFWSKGLTWSDFVSTLLLKTGQIDKTATLGGNVNDWSQVCLAIGFVASPILSQICIITCSGCRTRFGLLVTRWSPQAAAALTATRCAQICGCNRYIIGMCLTVLYTVMTHPTHINALFCIRTSLIFPPIMHPPMNTPITPSCPSPPQEATFWQKDGGLDFAEYTMASSKSSQPLFTPVSDITNLFPRPSHPAMMQYRDRSSAQRWFWVPLSLPPRRHTLTSSPFT